MKPWMRGVVALLLLVFVASRPMAEVGGKPYSDLIAELVFGCQVANPLSVVKGRTLVKGLVKGIELNADLGGAGIEPLVVAGQPDPLPLAEQEIHRGEVECVEGPHRSGERLGGPGQNRAQQFDEGEPSEQGLGGRPMGDAQSPTVQAIPDFIFEQPAGDDRLLPDRQWWAPVLRQQMGQRHRGVEIDHRLPRS